MKKLIVLMTLTLTFVLAISLNAQTEKENHLKNDMKNLDKRESEVNKEKTEVRKEMRKLGNQEISEQTKQHFESDFTNSSETRWERTSKFDEVAFTKDGRTSKAYYDDNTKLVGTTSNKNFSDLPVKAQRFINRNYRSYTSGDVSMYHYNRKNKSKMVLYNEPFASADYYFVEMKSDNKRIVLKVNMDGGVSYFAQTQ